MRKLRVTWDIEKAQRMWDAGVKAADIAYELSTSRRRLSDTTITSAADRYGWSKRAKPKANRRHAGMVLKRCACRGVYYAKPLDHTPHVCRVPVEPLSGVAA